MKQAPSRRRSVAPTAARAASRRAATHIVPLIVGLGVMAFTVPSAAQDVAQPAMAKGSVAGFNGTADTLVREIGLIQGATGGRVLDIRFSNHQGRPGYYAVVAQGNRVEFMRIEAEGGQAVQIDAASGPVWMLDWRGKRDVQLAESAPVSLARAIQTAEAANGAPAVAAGIARSASNPSSDVHAYNVLVDVHGTAQRVAVDDSSGQVIANPGALTAFGID